MYVARVVILSILLFSISLGAKEEILYTENGEAVVVRTEERSSGRGWIRLGVGAILLACGGAAVASQRSFKRPKNRTRPGSNTTAIRKPTRPSFNKPKNRS